MKIVEAQQASKVLDSQSRKGVDSSNLPNSTPAPSNWFFTHISRAATASAHRSTQLRYSNPGSLIATKSLHCWSSIPGRIVRIVPVGLQYQTTRHFSPEKRASGNFTTGANGWNCSLQIQTRSSQGNCASSDVHDAYGAGLTAPDGGAETQRIWLLSNDDTVTVSRP